MEVTLLSDAELWTVSVTKIARYVVVILGFGYVSTRLLVMRQDFYPSNDRTNRSLMASRTQLSIRVDTSWIKFA